MPIQRTTETIRPTQSEFGQIAYDVMDCVYAIHNDFGCFFDEAVYKRELADRMLGMELELPVTSSHGTFSQLYKLDVLVHKRGIFEFKAAESIVGRHKAQTINYLLLFDLPHGLIINVRPGSVGKEFVNCHQRLEELKNPSLGTTNFCSAIAGAAFFPDQLLSLIRDWGSGLDTGLYEEALTHFLGGEEQVLLPVPVLGAKAICTIKRYASSHPMSRSSSRHSRISSIPSKHMPADFWRTPISKPFIGLTSLTSMSPSPHSSKLMASKNMTVRNIIWILHVYF